MYITIKDIEITLSTIHIRTEYFRYEILYKGYEQRGGVPNGRCFCQISDMFLLYDISGNRMRINYKYLPEPIYPDYDVLVENYTTCKLIGSKPSLFAEYVLGCINIYKDILEITDYTQHIEKRNSAGQLLYMINPDGFITFYTQILVICNEHFDYQICDYITTYYSLNIKHDSVFEIKYI
jgi:hypothetical protein